MLAKVRLVISKHSGPADLRSHLILLVLATMLPLLVFAVAMIVRLGKEERATFERGATDQTRALLTAVDTKLKSSVATLEALTTLRELDTGDLRGVYDGMTRTLKSQPDWFTINLADPSGQQILNLIRLLGSDLPMIQERQSFERVLRTSKPAIGHVVIGPVTKQPEFSVRVPVMRDGVVKYVLSAVVRPQSISQLLLAQRLPSDWIGGVLDGNRRFVARTIEPERNVGQLASTSLRDALDRAPEGWFYGTSIEGWETYTPYNRSAFSGWTVALAIPAALVEASLRRSFLFVAGFGLILLALGITLAWFFSSRTTRSIESLSRMSENLGLGKGAGATTTAATDFPIAEVESVREALLSASRLIQERSAEREQVEQALTRQAETLRENQARFSGVINSAMDAVIALNAAQRIVVFNIAAEQMFGCVAAEALGSSLDRFIPPRFREAHHGHIEKFGRTGVTSRRMGALGALSGLRANGEEFPIEASISQMKVGGENLFTVILRDITERKQTEHRRDVTYAITQILAESPSLDDATPRILKTIGQKLDWEVGDLWTADSDANVLRCVKMWHDPSLIVDKFVSVSYERTFTPGAGLPGRVWTSLKPAWIPDVTKDDNFPRAPFAVEAGLHAGFAFPILFGAKFLGVMEFFSREIRNPNDALLVLFDSIGSQIGQFMERKRTEEALREADRRKDEFLAMLGHELRNPLGVINTAACLLPTDGPPDLELVELRDTIKLEVSQMARLLDDLLDISRIERGLIRLKKEPCDLAAIVRQVVENRRPVLEETGLDLSLDVPPQPLWVIGDRTRLAQIVGNLLDNANKFTDRGGQVTVRLSEDLSEKAALLIVRDSGIGIEPALLALVFEPFVQADKSLDRSRNGLGLGLALVKGLVELQSAEVRASSDGLGRGSEFTVRLPLAEAPASLVQPNEPAVKATHCRRILVIEDNSAAAQSLQKFLVKNGHTVEVALSGSDGIDAAQRFQPEIVLCDIGLPRLDGFAVAQALRQEPKLKGAYLIAVSGYGQEGNRRRALEAGFDRYLTKPIDLAELERLFGSSTFDEQAAKA